MEYPRITASLFLLITIHLLSAQVSAQSGKPITASSIDKMITEASMNVEDLPRLDPDAEIINIRASLYQVSTDLTGSTQAKLEEHCKKAIENGAEDILGMAVSANSNRWARLHRGSEIWIPTKFAGNEIVKSPNDKGAYSLPLSSQKGPDDGTYIISGYATDLEKKKLGYFLKVKPVIQSDKTIQLEGSLRETFVSGFKESFPATNVTRKVIGKQKRIVEFQPAQQVPVLKQANRPFRTAKKKSVKHYIPYSIHSDTLPSSDQGNRGFPPNFDAASPIIQTDSLSQTVSPGILVLEAVKDRTVDSRLKPARTYSSEVEKQIYITSKFIETEQAPSAIDMILTKGSEDLTGTLTDPQFQMTIRQLNQTKGVDLLSAPSLMVRDGNPGKIEVIRPYKIVSKFKPIEQGKVQEGGFPFTPAAPEVFKEENCGVTWEATATQVGNSKIKLKIATTVRTFTGNCIFSQPVFMLQTKLVNRNQPIVITENRIEAPVFSLRQSESEIIIPDGTTVAISMLKHNHRLLVQRKFAGPKKKEYEKITPRYLTIFFKAQIMDPAGAPINVANHGR